MKVHTPDPTLNTYQDPESMVLGLLLSTYIVAFENRNALDPNHIDI